MKTIWNLFAIMLFNISVMLGLDWMGSQKPPTGPTPERERAGILPAAQILPKKPTSIKNKHPRK